MSAPASAASSRSRCASARLAATSAPERIWQTATRMGWQCTVGSGATRASSTARSGSSSARRSACRPDPRSRPPRAPDRRGSARRACAGCSPDATRSSAARGRGAPRSRGSCDRARGAGAPPAPARRGRRPDRRTSRPSPRDPRGGPPGRLDVRLTVQDPGDRVGELGRRRPLEHVALRSRLERPTDVRGAVHHREDQDQRVRESLGERLDDGRATPALHGEVGDDDVGVRFERELERFLGGGRLGHDGNVRLRFQQHPDAGANDGMVVHQQHGRDRAAHARVPLRAPCRRFRSRRRATSTCAVPGPPPRASLRPHCALRRDRRRFARAYGERRLQRGRVRSQMGSEGTLLERPFRIES